MRTDTQNFTVTMVWEDCCFCGIAFGMTKDFEQRRREDHQSFYCPNGHGQSYRGKTAQQKRIDQLKRQVAHQSEWNEELIRERAALTSEQRDLARHVAANYEGANAQKGAFWRGHTAKECDECIDSCPYPTNRYGFRTAWYDGYGAGDPEAADPSATEGGENE